MTLENGNFEIGTDKIKGTENGANAVIVTNGYIFVMTKSEGAKVYKAEGFTAESEPVKVFDNVTTGFVQSKDGSVWAAKSKDYLKINPLDLTSESVTIDAAAPAFSSTKQPAWVASTTENAMYFTASSGVAKYDITTGTLTNPFLTKADDFDGYMLYSTSLYFDPQRGELFCSTIKGYGPASAYNGLFSFTGDGTKMTNVLYDTTDSEIYGEKDMWFPAMMCSIKNFAAPIR